MAAKPDKPSNTAAKKAKASKPEAKPAAPKKPRKPLNLLSQEVKEFLVKAHAQFRRPKYIMQDVKDLYGIELNNMDVLRYNPRNQVYAAGVKLRQLFEEERARYIMDREEVPGFHMKNRIESLQRMAHRAEDQGNNALAAQILEQIAKEAGGMYTNRRQVDVGGGEKPVQMEVTQDLKQLPKETLVSLAELAERLNQSGFGNR